ncbi:ATP-binding protein [Luteimonas saliphila]|uniref:ATP-binding protein n=1 Tax=Luteimonas saliphila TaxID=2804919 RepID=UPI00192E2025
MHDSTSIGRSDARAPRLLQRWLGLARVDPADRRNASMLQAVLVASALFQPVSLALAWASAIGIDPLAVGMSLVNMVALLVSLALLRHGAFVAAARLFIAVALALLTVSYFHWGLAPQAPQQLLQLVPVLIGGALLSRRAMWTTVAWLVALVAVGGWRDAAVLVHRPDSLLVLCSRMLGSVFGFVLAAFVLDQALTGLRENLALARRRGNELAAARDRLQLEMQEKERQRDQLVHAQKMEGVGRLSSGVAHDFNHLLTLVLGHATRGRTSTTLDDAHDALLDVQSAARRAAAVSRRLLDFGRMEDARPEVFDPAAALAEMRPMLRQLFSARTRLELPPQPSPGLIRFDRAQFELILLGLAANAEYAMPEGGRFTVEVASAGSGMLEISARDDGHGMDAAVRERCLEPFFTTKPSGQGTGLGLAVAASLVQASGGTLVVDSAPGHGTNVRMALPLAASIGSERSLQAT